MRPDTLDKSNILVTLEALSNIRPENLGIVFTHCDENPGFTKQKGHKFITSLFEATRKDMAKDGYQIPPVPGEDRIFLNKV